MWTFGRKLAAGFALSFVLLVAVGFAGYRGVEGLRSSSYAVAHSHEVLERVAEVMGLVTDVETAHRGFVITGDDAFLEPQRRAVDQVDVAMAELRRLTADNDAQQQRLDQVEPIVTAKLDYTRMSIAKRRTAGFESVRVEIAAAEGKRLMDELRRSLGLIEQEERRLLEERAADVEATGVEVRLTILGVTVTCIVLVTLVGLAITRGVASQIGAAVREVQSSSAELQAAANQQVSGTKEQVGAMAEIGTTITELLATSRQIAASAQRVAHNAAETATSARSGDVTVEQAHASIVAIRRQVDAVVVHMLELGKKSQQIGAVLDIVSELAEQTNILAINATIEAAGAGEAGKRFAVVADEIRKLADRVGGSTKEIRTLIEDVRAAVNVTVMATEGGSKAVDAGTAQFGEVAAALRRITDLVAITTDASREIELSTKQQTTAVEQVKIAIADVSRASRESEVSSSQTLMTAQELTKLSRGLLRLIEPDAAA